MNKEKIIVLLLAAINFTHIIDFMIMMPLGPQLMRTFQINPQEFGLIVSAYTFSAGISGFLAAFFVDKFDRKQVLLFGYIGFLVGTFACGIAPSYALLMTARIIAGTFGGLIGAQIFAIIGDLVPYERRSSAMGNMSAAFSVASVIGIPFGLYIATEFSWHAPFLLVGALGVMIVPLVYQMLPKMTAHIQHTSINQPFAVIQNIVKDRNQQIGLFFGTILMIGHFSIIPFISPYMVANVGFSEKELTYIYLVGGVLTFFSSPLVGRLADKYGKLRMFTLVGILALLPIFLITNMPRIPIQYALVATALFFVFASSRFIPANAMITALVSPQQRGGFMSISSSVQQLASGFASFAAGFVITKSATGELQNYQYVGYASILVSIACIFVAQKLKSVNVGKN
ncbi:MAG: MFS transporter [Cytophagales bacterium]|nr:MAG: MFS transporter [Cytophagales bacterium]